METAWQEGGEEGCRRHLEIKRDEWKGVSLNVAVIGNSGVGKSCFINAIRGLTADDKGGAPVDVTETTKEIVSYQHPGNPSCLFWDLPGVGTDHFPRESYLSKIDVDRYVFFLLITADRFTENDTWLGKEIHKRNKKYFFVRTKIGLDIFSNKRSHPRTHNEKAVIEKIRKSTEDQLTENGFADVQVFLIDNHEPNKFQFEKLKQQLITDFKDLQRTALIFSLHSTSKEMIKLKVDELRSRIWRSALLSVAAAAIPVPGISVIIDLHIIVQESLLYFKQLGLDSESLKRTAKLYSVDYEKIQSIVSKELGIRDVDSVTDETMKSIVINIISSSKPFMADTAVEESVKTILQLIGHLIAPPMSFGETDLALKLILEKFQEVALAVINSAADSAHVDDETDDEEATSHN